MNAITLSGSDFAALLTGLGVDTAEWCGKDDAAAWQSVSLFPDHINGVDKLGALVADICSSRERCAVLYSELVYEGHRGTNHTNQPIVCYVKEENGAFTVTTWHGETIGRARVVSSWRVTSCYGSRMYAFRVRLDSGAVYAGRGFGAGMSLSAKRCKAGYWS